MSTRCRRAVKVWIVQTSISKYNRYTLAQIKLRTINIIFWSLDPNWSNISQDPWDYYDWIWIHCREANFPSICTGPLSADWDILVLEIVKTYRNNSVYTTIAQGRQSKTRLVQIWYFFYKDSTYKTILFCQKVALSVGSRKKRKNADTWRQNIKEKIC